MGTLIRLELPQAAADRLAADPEGFKKFMAESGFNVTDVIVHTPKAERTEFGFERTTCACANCSINCQFIPGYLIPADMERIAAAVGSENLVAFATDNLLASPGAIVGTSDGRQHRIPTLVPARRLDGACKFLSGDGQCTIHEVSPFGCAFFGDHQSREESDWRSLHGLQAIDEAWNTTGSMYSLLWLLLNEAGLNAPEPMVARAKMKAALAVAANQ